MIHSNVCRRVHSIQYRCRKVHYLHVLSTIWSTPHLLVVVALSSGHTYLPANSTAVYCTLDSRGIHSTAVPGFVDSNFSLSPIFCHRVHYIAACLPALGFVCCSAHSTAVCHRVHSAYWSHAVTPLSAPQLSAILHSCPLWDPLLVCLLHSYLPPIATALKLLRRIDLISCRLRTVRNHTLKSTSKI